MKRINLIPSEVMAVRSSKSAASGVVRIVIAGVVFCVVLYLWQSVDAARLKKASGINKKKISELAAILSRDENTYENLKAEREGIASEIRRIRKKLETIRFAKTRKMSASSVLKRLSEFVPQDLWINKVALDHELVTITGTTFDNVGVSRFMSGLDRSDMFEKTSFKYTEKKDFRGRSLINFEVTTLVISEPEGRNKI